MLTRNPLTQLREKGFRIFMLTSQHLSRQSNKLQAYLC